MDLVTFQDDYPELAGFLLEFNANLYREAPLSEEKVLNRGYDSLRGDDYPCACWPMIKRQAEEVLRMDPFPWAAIADLALRHHGSPEAYRAWFIDILDRTADRIGAERVKVPGRD